MRARRELLISVPFVGSVLALAVNDHVLKPAWPGLVTGKLSDVAGVVMVAILATAIVGRRTLGVGITAIGLVALKTITAVAVAAAPVLGGTTRTDPTDLFALVVLIPLWSRLGRPSLRPPTVAKTAYLLPLQLVAVTAAVLVTTATSCEGSGVLEVVAVDGVVYAITVGDVFESTDGGATWVSSSVPSWDERLDHRYPETRTDCSELERCFEVVHPNDEPSVAISIDQITPDRRTILTVSPDQLQRLTNVALPQCGDESFDSLATVDLPDGNHVVLSMGDIGVLHHRPDRSWEWVAVGDFGLRSDQVAEEPFGFAAASTVTDDWWERWPVGLVLALLVLAPVAVGLATVPIVRLARRNGRDSTVGIVTSVVVALLLAAAGAFVLVFALGFGERGQAAVGAAVIASVAVCTIVPLLGWYARSRGEGRSPPKEQLPPDQWRPPHPSGRAG